MERERNPSNRVECALAESHSARRSPGNPHAQALLLSDDLKRGVISASDLILTDLMLLEYLDARINASLEPLRDIAVILRLGRRIQNIPDIFRYVADKTWTKLAIGVVGISRRIGPLPH